MIDFHTPKAHSCNTYFNLLSRSRYSSGKRSCLLIHCHYHVILMYTSHIDVCTPNNNTRIRRIWIMLQGHWLTDDFFTSKCHRFMYLWIYTILLFCFRKDEWVAFFIRYIPKLRIYLCFNAIILRETNNTVWINLNGFGYSCRFLQVTGWRFSIYLYSNRYNTFGKCIIPWNIILTTNE